MAEKSPSRAPRTTRAPKTPTTTSQAAAPKSGTETAPGPAAPQQAVAPKASRVKASGTRAAGSKAAAVPGAKRAMPPTTPAGRRAAASEAKAPRAAAKTSATAPKAASRQPSRPRAVAAKRPLSVLVVSSEAVPFSPPGTLGDLVGVLPAALGALGHRVTVVVPKYAGVTVPSAPVDRFTVPFGDGGEEAACYEVPLGPNARAVLVDHPGFFEREFVYGGAGDDYPDNPRRFAFLSRAALEFAAREGERIDIVHANDWQTGLVPVYLRTFYADSPALAGAKSVFTIHNIAFQGLCDAGWLGALGLGPELFSVEGLEYWGRVSLLKGGINFADMVSALGPDAGEELVAPGGGAGFEGILAARGGSFRSVLAGKAGDPLETGAWLPSRLADGFATLYAEAVAPQPAGR